MKLKLFFFALLAQLFSSGAAFAYDAEIDGIYYNFILSSEVEVTSGDDKYTGDIVIPEMVTYNKITYSVTSIGKYAFYNCYGLTSVTIGNSVSSIGDYAFNGCRGLTSVTIPESVTNIDNMAFSNCTNLNDIHISDVAAWCRIEFKDNREFLLPHRMFLNDVEITDLVIPEGVTDIGLCAFRYCINLTSVTIPKSVTKLSAGAFAGCI